MVTIAVRVTTESRDAAGDHPPKSTVRMPAGHESGAASVGPVGGVTRHFVAPWDYRSNR
jgi:hypothetical protein